ncbi:MAG: class B sortase [Pseudobutyrivibrio sp.]|nr:class B sortase [Pseudobutyrivibrio sp.]
MKKKSIIYLIGFVFFLVVITVSAAFMTRDTIVKGNAAETLDDIAKEVNDVDDVEMTESNSITTSTAPYGSFGITVPEKNLDWNELHKENEDIYAWITVTDTTIDYPVLQHPMDNAYYLNHNLDGSKGFPGVIYTENYNSKDFSDPHTVVYGHNLKAKTMFSSLHNYEKDSVFNKDQYIYIYTEDNVLVYKIFAAYEFNANHLLLNYDFTNEYVYEQYIKDIYNVASKGYGVAKIKPDIEVTKEDKIITLSTCTSDHDDNQRYLVVGVLMEPEGE